MLKKIAFGLALGAMLTFSACGGKHEPKNQTEGAQQEMPEADKSGPEYTSAYICPMYCPGSGSDQPGKCPKCGMDYVANDKASKDMPGHEGHNH
jgi:hypothetical protein